MTTLPYDSETISLFFDRFRPMHETKEVGQIVCGLIDIGKKSYIITETKSILSDFSSIPLLQTKKEEFYSPQFWMNERSHTVIFITHFHGIYTKILYVAKRSGKKIAIKADSDGRITFPVPPRIWTPFLPLPYKERIKNIGRAIKGLIFCFKKLNDIVQQVELSDKVMFETPQAVENFKKILRFCRREELIKKVSFCPSPIANDVVLSPIPKSKENIIIAVANWKAKLQKNTGEMLKTLTHISKKYPEWTICVIGDIEPEIKITLLENIQFVGKIDHKNVVDIMAKAKINFVPSIYESFCLSAAESLAMGCVVVGTPIEVMEFYKFPGPCEISKGFTSKELSEAIEKSIKREIDISERIEKAKWWREKLKRTNIAKIIISEVGT